MAALDGRDFVTPDDVKTMAEPVLIHRLTLRAEYELEGLTEPEVVAEILRGVSVPR
jgi:MoxR-like ATPase